MSLKVAFASVLKAIRTARGLSQSKLAEVSSRTYISKLERGQCSPTLEMISALSTPLSLSPLTLVALTIGTESGQSIRALVDRLERELSELSIAGTVNGAQASNASSVPRSRSRPKNPSNKSSSRQVEFCFAD